MPPMAGSLGLNYTEPSLTVGLLPRHTKNDHVYRLLRLCYDSSLPNSWKFNRSILSRQVVSIVILSVFSDTIRTSI